jgi:hypothetical protein
MRISYRIILIIWAILLSALGVLVYTTYSRLQPETIVSLLKEHVEKNYPGSVVKIGNMDYRPGLDLRLSFKDVEIIRPEGKLGSIGELEVRVPWWLLISDRGNAQINVNRLEVFLAHDPKDRKDKSKAGLDSKQIKVVLPEHMVHAKYTLRAKDIIIRDASDSRRNFILSKLLVKEFQYGKNSAFELNLPIEISHNHAKFTSELWLFGDLTPEKDEWRLNFRGEFKTRDLTDKSDLEDLAIDGKADFRPGELNLNSEITFLIERQEVGKGKVVADKSELALDFDFTAFPLEYLSIFSQELKNPYLPALSGPSLGMVRFRRNLKDEEALKLESRFSFDGTFPLDPDHTYAGKWQFSFSDSKWETSFITPRSEVSFFRRSIIDIPMGEVVQYIEEIGFHGIELDPAIGGQMTLPQFRTLSFPNYYSTKVSLSDCLQGEAKVNGTLFHGFTPTGRFYQLDITGNGDLKFNYRSRENSENISLEAKDFVWAPDYNFFSPVFTAEAGLLNGKLEGKWENVWNTGTWLSQLKVTGLKAQQGELPSLIQKLWSEFTLDANSQPDQTWTASVKADTLNLTNLSIDSTDPAKLVGVVAPAPRKSHLTLTYPKNKKWKPVRKDLPEFTW